MKAKPWTERHKALAAAAALRLHADQVERGDETTAHRLFNVATIEYNRRTEAIFRAALSNVGLTPADVDHELRRIRGLADEPRPSKRRSRGDPNPGHAHPAADPEGSVKPWTEAHRREALRRSYELAAELADVNNRKNGATWIAVHAFDNVFAEGAWRALLSGGGIDDARIDREIGIVRVRVERAEPDPAWTTKHSDAAAIEFLRLGATISEEKGVPASRSIWLAHAAEARTASEAEARRRLLESARWSESAHAKEIRAFFRRVHARAEGRIVEEHETFFAIKRGDSWWLKGGTYSEGEPSLKERGALPIAVWARREDAAFFLPNDPVHDGARVVRVTITRRFVRAAPPHATTGGPEEVGEAWRAKIAAFARSNAIRKLEAAGGEEDWPKLSELCNAIEERASADAAEHEEPGIEEGEPWLHAAADFGLSAVAGEALAPLYTQAFAAARAAQIARRPA